MCAENVTGLKTVPKLRRDTFVSLVDERCVTLRSHSGSNGGGSTSENAGISSENYVRIIMVESLRFPEEGSSAQG